MNSKRLDDAFSPTPEVFSNRVDVTLSRIQEMSYIKKRVKTRITLVAAIVLLIALTTAAFATGAIQSIFRAMVGRYEQPTVDFSAMDEMSNVDVAKEDATFDQTGVTAAIEIVQSYYDGEQIMLGARFTRPRVAADLRFGPGNPEFQTLTGASWDTLNTLKNALTEAEYDEFVKTYRETGRAGVMYYEYYPSDGFALTDGTPLGYKADADNFATPDETINCYYQSLSPLPEAARNLERVSGIISVYQAPIYRYMDATSEYEGVGEREKIPVHFTVKRSAEAGAKRAVTRKLAQYAVRAALTPTLVDTHIAVQLSKPQRWDDSFDGRDGKISDYQLLADGAIVNGALTDSPNDSQDTRTGVFAPLPEGTKIATLRPVYSRIDAHGQWSGIPNPDEDIVFDLTKPPVEAKAKPSSTPVPTAQPVAEEELIERGKSALINMGFAAEEELSGVSWNVSSGDDSNYEKHTPRLRGESRDASVSEGSVSPLTLYYLCFDPDSLMPYDVSAKTVGPGHTNGNALMGKPSEAAYRRWDKIIQQDNWTNMAEKWLRQYAVSADAQIKHLNNRNGGGNIYGYQCHHICVRFQDEAKAIHDVIVNPDNEQIVEYRWFKNKKVSW